MRDQLKKVRATLVRWKVYMGRTSGYISMINSGMILFLLLSSLEQYGIDIEIQQWIIPLFVLGTSTMIVFGFIEDKLGFYRAEQYRTQSNSPVLSEILTRVRNIEQELKNNNSSQKK